MSYKELKGLFVGSDGRLFAQTDESQANGLDSDNEQQQRQQLEPVLQAPLPVPVIKKDAVEVSYDNSSELSEIYKIYVAYECILINLVGFGTLFFQCELQAWEAKFKESHPDVSDMNADIMFGHFWLKGDLNCSTL